METTRVMSVKERVRLEVFSRVSRRELSVGKAAGLLGIGVRQAKGIRKRFAREGDAGLVHRLRGRPGNAARQELREKVLHICRGEYADFGCPQAAEQLEKLGLRIPRQTLWRRRAQTLARVRRSQVRDEAKRNIDTFAPGGGYVFPPVHNIQFNVPPENIAAAYEAAAGA